MKYKPALTCEDGVRIYSESNYPLLNIRNHRENQI